MYLALAADARRRLEEGLKEVVDRVGGRYPSTIVYVLLTGRAAG